VRQNRLLALVSIVEADGNHTPAEVDLYLMLEPLYKRIGQAEARAERHVKRIAWLEETVAHKHVYEHTSTLESQVAALEGQVSSLEKSRELLVRRVGELEKSLNSLRVGYIDKLTGDEY
jgi:chromosome segregation ATPase